MLRLGADGSELLARRKLFKKYNGELREKRLEMFSLSSVGVVEILRYTYFSFEFVQCLFWWIRVWENMIVKCKKAYPIGDVLSLPFYNLIGRKIELFDEYKYTQMISKNDFLHAVVKQTPEFCYGCLMKAPITINKSRILYCV